ncbi:MAG: Stealth CR1 domain-containing protein [Muribaculaceae bacterium]|nr:Stealth CR1 domain-containing protein [Muribaculaceae bacterium]
MESKSEAIDAVIAWVDGNDPKLNAKRAQYIQSKITVREDVGGTARFSNIGEIYWCVASINKFAPWFRKIYIITDGQDPKIDEHLPKGSDINHIPVEIVDHKVIFKDYEEYLPVFNSLAIETMMWRIPGLSEKFIYFNDDFLLANPVTPSDFFTPDGLPIARGYRHSTFTAWFLREMNYISKLGKSKVKFRDTMVQAATTVKGKALVWFVRVHHTPHALVKSQFERFFKHHPHAFINNISYKFRNRAQLLPIEVIYLYAINKLGAPLEDMRQSLVYFDAKNPSETFKERFKKLIHDRQVKFICINSFERFTPNAQRLLAEWFNKRLGMKLAIPDENKDNALESK